MGSCICKELTENDVYEGPLNQTLFQTGNLLPAVEDSENFMPTRSGNIKWEFSNFSTTDKLVLETLNFIGSRMEK